MVAAEIKEQGRRVMAKEKLLVLGEQDPWDWEVLQAEFDCTKITDAAQLDALSDEACAAFRLGMLKFHYSVDGAFFDRFPNLKVFANYGVGYDSIDVDAAAARGIAVTNTPDVLSADVADLSVLMLLSLLRRSNAAEQWLRDGKWSSVGAFPLQRKMSGGRVGIVGLGRIGRAIGDRMAAFDCPIHYYSRAPKQTPDDWTYHASPQDLAASVDFLIVALAGGADTAGLVDRATIEALGPNGIIVNISRGTTIDEPAMIEALENKSIGGAALDVFVGEPNPDPRFLALDNVVLQPHVASATVETRKAMGALVRANLIACRDGTPLLTQVN